MQRLLLAALLAVAIVRIASTYRVFSQTVDEPVHIAAGYEWLTTRHYDLSPDHPPIARATFALWSLINGAKPATANNEAGNDLLFHDDHYLRNLTGSRAPNLVFLLIATWVVFAWTRRGAQFPVPSAQFPVPSAQGVSPGTGHWAPGALVAAALFTGLPPVLAHAGLATTDMVVAATVVAALYAFTLWLESPTRNRALIFGLACGLGLVSKFSFLPFFLPAAATLLIARRGRMRWRQLPAVIAIAFVIVWGVYKFDVGKLIDARLRAYPRGIPHEIAARYARNPGYEWMRADLLKRYYDYGRLVHGTPPDIVDWAKASGYPSPLAGRSGNTMAGQPPIPPLSLGDRLREPDRAAWQWIAVHVPLPAPMFIAGLEVLTIHNQAGHPAYLLGRYADHGWWYYFPVILFFKTPLAFLLLWATGFVLLVRTPGTRAFALLPIVMLIPPMLGGIDIGIRHVLPLYPLMAIQSAVAVSTLWNAARARIAWRAGAIILLAWLFIRGAVAHPDYLADFNEFAGNHPERIATDSNLDWGQDLLRLARYAKRQDIQPLYISYFGSVDPSRLGVHAEDLPIDRRVHGWVAISEMRMRLGPPDDRGGAYRWLEQLTPEQRIGKSIRLYRVP
jgi:hypothetical protein